MAFNNTDWGQYSDGMQTGYIWWSMGGEESISVERREGQNLYKKVMPMLHHNNLNDKLAVSDCPTAYEGDHTALSVLQWISKENRFAWSHVLLHFVYSTGFCGAPYNAELRNQYLQLVKNNMKKYEGWCLTEKADGQNMYLYAVSIVTDYEPKNPALLCYVKEEGCLRENTIYAYAQKGSSQNYYRSSLNLAICHETGTGTKVDFEKAMTTYCKSYLEGDSTARYKMGLYALRDGSFREAYSFLSASAEMNFPLACNLLGEWYEEGGADGSKNKNDAFELYQQGADQHYRVAEYNLGRCYDLKKDFSAAFKYYSRAFDQEPTEEVCLQLKLLQTNDKAHISIRNQCEQLLNGSRNPLATTWCKDVKTSRLEHAVKERANELKDDKLKATKAKHFGQMGMFANSPENQVSQPSAPKTPLTYSAPKTPLTYSEMFQLVDWAEESGILTVPEEYCGPLSFAIMRDPVKLDDGITYERKVIEDYIKSNEQKFEVDKEVTRMKKRHFFSKRQPKVVVATVIETKFLSPTRVWISCRCVPDRDKKTAIEKYVRGIFKNPEIGAMLLQRQENKMSPRQ